MAIKLNITASHEENKPSQISWATALSQQYNYKLIFKSKALDDVIF